MGLIDQQYIEMKWSGFTKDRYTALGYKFTKNGDKFYVYPHDLPPHSKKKVLVECDGCGKQLHVVYGDYTNHVRPDGYYYCVHCKSKINENKRNEYYNKLLDFCFGYNYSLITSKGELFSTAQDIEYECPEHGIQKTTLGNILYNNEKCPYCSRIETTQKNKLSEEEVLADVAKYNGTLLNVDEYKNTSEKNLKFVCPECGRVFVSSLKSFMMSKGQFCQECTSGESRGQRRVRHYLEDHNIKFEQEKWFDDCRDQFPLPFDFYLPDLNKMIEFDGQQHYNPWNNNKDLFAKTKKHDAMKTQYCQDKGIELLRIPYWHYKNVEKILDNFIYSHKDIV